MEKKITASEWNSQMRAQAQDLIAQNKLPALDELLKVVAETRAKYRPLIEAERRKKRSS